MSMQSKQLLEASLAVFLLIFLLPLLVLIALGIWFSSGRPIFFKQKRVGKSGQAFDMIKFRTMRPTAVAEKHKYIKLNQAPSPMFKIYDDPRYTFFGKWLSRYGLDELPQLWNIVKGEMKFIGPRPLPIDEMAKLGKSWAFRTKVKPGLFSEWTAAKNRHHSLEVWRELDKLTIRNTGLANDLRVIVKTIQMILKQT